MSRLPIKSPASRPVSIRLSDEERATLEQRAGALPLSRYVRRVLFEDSAPSYRQAPKRILEETVLLSKILAALGKGELQANIALIAGEAVSGNLHADMA